MRVYLDHAATTPVLEPILKKMLPYFGERFGNASSLHFLGEEAKEALEDARKTIAKYINSEPDEIYFTSGGTESDNIAIIGSSKMSERRHIVTSKIEHEAVIETAKYMQEQNYRVDFISVEENGIINTKELEKKLNEDTLIVSVMLANNEIGTIQPLKEMTKIAKRYGAIVHTDAVQAVGKMKIDVKELGIDMLSASAHKFYGPKGIGFLYIKKSTPVTNIIFGGGHERGMRSGTENVSGAVGMAAAIEFCYEHFCELEEKYKRWRDMILNACNNIEGFKLNGDPDKRVVNTLSLSFSGVNGEALAELLSMNEIAVSTASACSSHSSEKIVSHVLRAINLPQEYAEGTIRVVTGADNTDEQIEYFIEHLKKAVAQLRKMGGTA
ncbi:MAG: cysteine desulfurase [Synergistetes bacterium]|nr:cysteine desulfurase [Synergistota bacterium]